MNVTSDPLVYVQTRFVFERTLSYNFKILKLGQSCECPPTFVVNVLRSVEVALVVLSTFGTDPLTNLEILEFMVLVATIVTELTRWEETVYKHDLRAIPFCKVFQLFYEVYESKVLDFLPMFPLEKLEIQGFKADQIVLLTQFMSQVPVPIVPLVLNRSIRSVSVEPCGVPRV